MNHARIRRLTAGAVAMTLLAGVLTLLVMPPASANHSDRTLQASPERGFASAGTAQSVTITLSDAATAETGTIEIDAEVTADGDGDAPETPDTGCIVQVGANQCTFQVNSGAGTKLVKTWVDHDKKNEASQGGITELDRTEGRLADGQPDTNPTAGSETPPEADCRNPEDFSGANAVNGTFAGCGASVPPNNDAEPGSQAEPDTTDVVELNWFAASALNCVAAPKTRPTGDTRPVNPTGVGHGTDRFVQTTPISGGTTNDDIVIDCTFTSNGIRVDGVNYSASDGSTFDGGANDPSTSATVADYGQKNKNGVTDPNASQTSCNNSSGPSCTFIISPVDGETGPAVVCLWQDSDDDELYASAPGGAGTGADGEGCTDERVDDSENDDTTDRLALRWGAAPVATALNVEPETGTATVGTARTVGALVTDQFGDPFIPAPGASTTVGFEFFSGSAADTDAGSTTATPDKTCPVTSGSGGRCQVTYTSATAGTDALCGWIGAAPAMVDSPRTCGGEAAGNDAHSSMIDVTTFVWTAAATTTTAPTTTTSTPPAEDVSKTQGYTLVGADGGIFNFGTSKFHGSTGDIKLNQPVIGLANKKGGTGYWLVARDGGIFTFGDAEFFGSTGSMKLNAPILGMEATPSGKGYFLFAADGGIFTFGDATFYGSTGDMKLNAPAVGLSINDKGDGYWLVAQDGGIFSFGNVPFHGSTGSLKLNQPVFDMAPTAGDKGYWLVAKDGGIFSFGDAEGKFFGSAVGAANGTVIGLGTTPTFNGYWIADSAGGVFPFGDARALGDRRGAANNAAIVGFATVPKA